MLRLVLILSLSLGGNAISIAASIGDREVLAANNFANAQSSTVYINKSVLLRSLGLKPKGTATAGYLDYGLTNPFGNSLETDPLWASIKSGIDGQAVMDAKMIWLDVKNDLKEIAGLANSLDRWTVRLLEEYLVLDPESGITLATHIEIVSPASEFIIGDINAKIAANGPEKGNLKGEGSYSPAGVETGTPSGDKKPGAPDPYDNKPRKGFAYLWKTYSDEVILILATVAVMLGAAKLIVIVQNWLSKQ